MALVGGVFGSSGQCIFFIAADRDGIGSIGHIAVYVGYTSFVVAGCIGCALAAFAVIVTAYNCKYHYGGEHKFFHTTCLYRLR